MGLYATVLVVMGMSDRIGGIADSMNDSVGQVARTAFWYLTGKGPHSPKSLVYPLSDSVP
jgi:hypothetical protein